MNPLSLIPFFIALAFGGTAVGINATMTKRRKSNLDKPKQDIEKLKEASEYEGKKKWILLCWILCVLFLIGAFVVAFITN